MTDDELTAAARAARAGAGAARRAHARRGTRDRAADRSTPDAVALAAEAQPTLERFVELRAAAPDALDEVGAREILRELKAVGGNLRSLRLALTGAERGPELWTVVAALPADEALARGRARQARVRLKSDTCRTPAVGLRSRVRLYDTLTRLARAPAAARADRDLRLRPDRLPARPHRQRTAVRRLHVARGAGCARAATRSRLVHNITDVNDKIYEAAPGASAERAVDATAGTSRTRPPSVSRCPTPSRSRRRRCPRSSR